MKRFIFLGLYFTTVFIIPQNNKTKMLFNINGDLRNPSFFITQGYMNINSILFEVRKDSASNIFISDYSIENDSFLIPQPLTENNALNINPVGMWPYQNKIVFFQTNLKGTWDIAYRETSNGIWNDTKIVVDSNFDDTNISPVKWDGFFMPEFESVVYQKNNSIYLFTKKDTTESNELLIESTDNARFSFPTGVLSSQYHESFWQTILNVAAILTDTLNNNQIIIFERNLYTKHDSTFIVDAGNIKNPHFVRINYNSILTYEKIANGKSSIYCFDKYENSPRILILNDTLDGDFFNLRSEDSPRPLVDIFKRMEKFSYFPYTYNFIKDNISSFFISKGYSPFTDTMIITKKLNPATAIELIGYDDYEINYAVWEDSVKTNIKLFAYRLEPRIPDDVKVNAFPKEFILSQNYPNPFNPATTIKYSIPVETKHASSLQYVSLKVYDMLGREISTLVNEEKTPGNYEITFNGNTLSSGVYFYRLQAGSFSDTKKFVLMK